MQSIPVHPDMKSHTGGCISFGHGVYCQKSSKQKLITKSTTESELVGASDYLRYTLWSMNFIEAQGHTIESSLNNQDNTSAMSLEQNGMDRVKDKSITIIHCPTEEMLADFFIKPLVQGALFIKFWDVILGYSTHM